MEAGINISGWAAMETETRFEDARDAEGWLDFLRQTHASLVERYGELCDAEGRLLSADEVEGSLALIAEAFITADELIAQRDFAGTMN